MLERIARYFGKGQAVTPMTRQESFRMAMFTGVGLENYVPFRTTIRLEGQNYEVMVDEKGRATVDKVSYRDQLSAL